MKTNLFFTFCLLAVFGCTANAQNLITNPGMENATGWTTLLIANTPAENGPTVTWGYTADKPTAATGGVLHLQRTTAPTQPQIALFQKVTLESGTTYSFDGAFKISDGLNYWVEVFVGNTAPTADADYGDGQTKIAAFNHWGPPAHADGTFKADAGESKQFKPEEAGDYYLVIKIGCNAEGSYNLLLDNIFFGIPEVPEASFKVNTRAGFAPLAVTFTNTSLRATSYEWDFGDGSAKGTETNPTHTYANPGEYKVTLKASGAGGNHTVEKDKFIQVKAFPGQITGGGKLLGGNMQDASKWSISTLNSPAGQMPVATWNYTASVPKAGQGGALRIQGTVDNTTVQYCIYQKITLDASKVYRFNAAFKDLTSNLWHFWTEVFISDVAPVDGEDFGGGATQLCALSNWEDANSVIRGLDGTYKEYTNVKDYTPAATGEYYFVFKTGVYTGGSEAFDIVIDELLLEEIRTKPYTAFTATNSQGFSPLEVTFTNTTQFATSYFWTFGDGQTSTEENPKHTYNVVGKYSVSLKATNEKGDSIMVKNDFVSVNERPPLPEGEKLYGGNMEDGGYWYTARVSGASPVTPTWNYTENTPTGGTGGALRLQMTPPAGQGSNIALYQPITMKHDYVYTFDGLFKAIGETDQLWVQTYISDVKPTDTEDPYKEENTLGQLNTWADGSVKTYDGAFSGKAQKGNQHSGDLLSYHYTGTDGAVMYFILKIGTWEKAADIVLDNLSLQESLNLKASFSADATDSETAPFTVQFFDMSVNATSWLWNFGDGATSTEQDPEHTYTKIGTYSVSLTVSNGANSKTFTIPNMIHVGTSGIDAIDYVNCTFNAINGQITVDSDKPFGSIAIYDIKGMLIESAKPNAGNYTSGAVAKGIYIINVDGRIYKVAVK